MELGISVIIPIYNVEKYLEECLESVLNQNFFNYEIVCVDDGSTDKSSTILDIYAKRSDKICVIHQENKGQSQARNIGVERAKGKYICFLDGDDMLTKDALMKMWNAAEQDEIEILTYEVNSLWYETDILKRQKNKDAYYHIKNDYLGVKSGCDFFVEMIKKNDFIDSACLMLIRTKWVREKQIYFYPNAIFEDSVYALECYFKCEKMKHIKEGLYVYRVRSSSTMTEKYVYKHIYYRIWQYSECLRMIYTYAKNEEEEKAIAQYAEKCIANIKYVNKCLETKEMERIYRLTGLYGMLAKSLGINELSTNYNSELKLIGLLSEMNSYSKTLIYGAGVVGNKIKNYMCMNDLSEKLIGFAVSQKQNLSYRNDLNIKCISEYEVSDEILVVIAAQENYHKDMLEHAKQCGYKRIRMIDYEMECMLDRKLQEM